MTSRPFAQTEPELAARAARIINQRDAARALLFLETVAAPTRHEPRLQRLRARCLTLLGQWRAARVCLERIRREHPGDLDAALALIAVCRRLGDARTASQISRAVARNHPDTPRAILAQVDSLLRRGTSAKALDLIKRICPQPTAATPAIQCKYAEVLRANGYHDKARQVLVQLVLAKPGAVQARVQLVSVLRYQGHVARAEAILSDGLRRAPRNAELALCAARGALDRGQTAQALGILDKALVHNPAHLGLARRRIAALQRLGQFEAARATQEALASAHPHDPDIQLDWADCLREVGRDRDADAILKRVALQAPRLPRLVDQKLDQALAAGDQKALVRMAGVAARLASADATAARRLALILLNLPAEPREDSLTWLDLLARRSTALGAGQLWNLAQLAGRLGDEALSARYLTAIFERSQFSAYEAALLLNEVYAADPALAAACAQHLENRMSRRDQMRFVQERAALLNGPEQGLKQRPRLATRSPSEQLALSSLLLQAGRLDLGERYLRRACRTAPTHAGLMSRYLTTLLLSGKIEPALAEIDQILTKDAPELDSMRAVAVQALVNAGAPDRADATLSRITSRSVLTRLLKTRLRLHLRFGRLTEAERALQELRKRAPLNKAAHLNPTLEALELLEGRMAQAGDTDDLSEAARFTTSAMAVIDSMRPEEPGTTLVPNQVMQYWHDGKPPAMLSPIMTSWQQARGLHYHLFDKPSALQFLADRFDLSWATALNMANHPAEQSDFFRLCWLAAEGGVYADCDDRLHGNWRNLTGAQGLLVFREGFGAISNNLIAASRAHPAIVEAAVSARQNLLNRDNDSTWAKTGPGLLTRAVASWLVDAKAQGCDPDVTLHDRHVAGRTVQVHTPLPYKKTQAYWNRSAATGAGIALAKIFAMSSPTRDNVASPEKESAR